MTYKQVSLLDIATVERAKKNVIYPAGITAVQISATRGQVEYIDRTSKIGTQYVVLKPYIKINSKYFNMAVKNSMPGFLHRYQNGLNVKVDDFKHMKIWIEDDIAIQDEQIKKIDIIDRSIRLSEKELGEIKNFKTSMLSKLLV